MTVIHKSFDTHVFTEEVALLLLIMGFFSSTA